MKRFLIICAVCNKFVEILSGIYDSEKCIMIYRVKCHNKIEILQITDEEMEQATSILIKKAFTDEV